MSTAACCEENGARDLGCRLVCIDGGANESTFQFCVETKKLYPSTLRRVKMNAGKAPKISTQLRLLIVFLSRKNNPQPTPVYKFELLISSNFYLKKNFGVHTVA
jgi:hypothetical protein